MRHILCLGILVLAGCESINGPFAPRAPVRVDDPKVSIAEQQYRSRDRYPLPDESQRTAAQLGNLMPIGR